MHAARQITIGSLIAAAAFAAQQALPSLSVYTTPGFQLVASAAVACLVLLGTRVRYASSVDRTVDAAVSCWPPPRGGAIDPYDFGVRPGRDGDYATRPEVDRALRAALDTGAAPVVLLVGEAGAGKTRAAVEAVRDASGTTAVVAPENGPALATLLGLEPLDWVPKRPSALWLDDLERYLTDLQLDALDALAKEGMKVVATIRSDAFGRLVGGDTPEGRTLRRLASRATVISVPRNDAWGDAEWRGDGTPLSTVVHGDSGRGRRLLRRVDVVAPAAGLLLALLALGALALAGEVRKPAPLADQLDDQQRAASSCGPVSTYPPGTESKTYYLVAHVADGCAASDMLKVFAVRHGRLKLRQELQPPRSATGALRLVCRGSLRDNPCVIPGTAGPHDPAFVGAWVDPTGLTLPFAVVRRGDRFAIERVVRGRTAPQAAAGGRYAHPIALRFPRLGPTKAFTFAGYPVEDFVLVQDYGVPVIARAVIWRGSALVPTTLKVTLSSLDLGSRLRASSCVDVGPRMIGNSRLFAAPRPLPALDRWLRARWMAALRRNVSC